MEWLNHLIPASPEARLWLDMALEVTHTAMVLFVLTGWLWRRSVPYHLVLLLVIWGAWVGLGYYVGHLGYCPLTDWHWRVKAWRGEAGMPPSFIEHMLNWVFPQDFDNRTISWVTMVTFLLITLASLARYHAIIRKGREVTHED